MFRRAARRGCGVRGGAFSQPGGGPSVAKIRRYDSYADPKYLTCPVSSFKSFARSTWKTKFMSSALQLRSTTAELRYREETHFDRWAKQVPSEGSSGNIWLMMSPAKRAGILARLFLAASSLIRSRCSLFRSKCGFISNPAICISNNTISRERVA